MNCRDFDRWLDDGRTREDRTAAGAHAAACPRCAAVAEAARSIEQTLGQRFATTSDDFTSAVMARIEPRPGVALPPVLDEPTLPWWIRVFQEPVTVASFVFAAVFFAWGPELVPRLDVTIVPATSSLAAGEPLALLALASIAVVGLGLTAWALFRISMAFASGWPRTH